jgi:tRNA G18 (ribose-2'-O)-methylase SpoU
MLHIRPIASLDADPNLQPYRTMRRQMEQRQQGIFVAEGEKVVRRLLESNFSVVSVLLPEKWLQELEPLLKSRPEEIQIYVADKGILESLTGFSMYQGVLAVGKIPAPASLDQILKGAPSPLLLAAVDGLTNAENLGTLVRNCAAFGVQALLVGETSSSPFLRRAVRSSMGGIFKVPVVETNSLVKLLQVLRVNQLRCIGAHPHTQQKTLAQADLSTDCCIVFGSEGYGISPPVLAVCDELVAIPMASEVDSLNVGSAAAAFLYEANRQRGKA